MSDSPASVPDPNSKNEEVANAPVLHFDLGKSLLEIEQRLIEEKSKINSGKFSKRDVECATPSYEQPVIKQSVAPALFQNTPATDTFSTSLLDELALEANNKLEENRSVEQIAKASAQRLNDALEQIAKYFRAFVRHTNNMEPTISLSYRLDARTVFDKLKWRGAYVDFRKQDLSPSAALDYVAFIVRYCAEGPVIVTRPWTQLASLNAELARLNLHVLDENDLDARKARQEWLQAALAPEVPVLLELKGNFKTGLIEVLSRNILSFGVETYTLDPAEVSPALLDDIGRALLGRTDKMPYALQHVKR